MSQDISDISFDRSTLDPNYQTESSSASSTMSGGGEPVSSRSCRGAYYTGADDKVASYLLLFL
jgi:hypothetical protein